MSRNNILVHISGSISAYKACGLISLLIQKGFNVQVTATENAFKFVGKSALEGLSRRPVLTDMFDGKNGFVPHIDLAQNWADLLIAYPASASCINRLASGMCDDLFGAICLANNYRKPLLISPAMNEAMFFHPAVQESLNTLTSWGTIILPSGNGHLACGTDGCGRLIEPIDAFAFIEGNLK